jgi:DNA modification methylase
MEIEKKKRIVVNKFNNLTSKEWLPFQKSWFFHTEISKLLKENLRFFTQGNSSAPAKVLLKNFDISKEEIQSLESEIFIKIDKRFEEYDYDFVALDLRRRIAACKCPADVIELKSHVFEFVTNCFPKLSHRKFLWVIAENKIIDKAYYPIAWEIGLMIAQVFSLKDEKIGLSQNHDNLLYSLYFRNDENNPAHIQNVKIFFEFETLDFAKKQQYPASFILRPQRRNKLEILHPAKYPEELASIFIEALTKQNETVFDPMSGTGSTQVAAIRLGRNAFGTELSEYFGSIANERVSNELGIFNQNIEAKVAIMDAMDSEKANFPKFNLILTSPPYWDMLNMRGAENQAKRRDQGLQLNYSDQEKDLGNVADYEKFVDDLSQIYLKLHSQMQENGKLVIVVKNVKKKGKNYPLAWDIALKIQPKFALLNEAFWCQDDQSIAPFGYGNTWVSNTFHHYCLVFQKK